MLRRVKNAAHSIGRGLHSAWVGRGMARSTHIARGRSTFTQDFHHLKVPMATRRPTSGTRRCSSAAAASRAPQRGRRLCGRGAAGPPDRRKQGPIQFLENNPTQSSLWVRFMCPKTRRNWLRLPIVRFHPGSSCPQTAARRRSHTRGRRPPPFSARSRVSWHTVNLRSAHLAPILRTSEHFHVFSPPHA